MSWCNSRHDLRLLVLAGAAMFLCSCGEIQHVDEKLNADAVVDTDLTDQDIQTAARTAAESLASCAELASVSGSPPVIALVPMKNRTVEDDFDNYDILPRVREQMVKCAGSRLVFSDQKAIETIMRLHQWHDITRTNAVEFRSLAHVDYFLTGRAYSHVRRLGGKREVYYRLSFFLLDASTAEIVWETGYETKKQGTYEILQR